jgi:hypothetical protein
MIRMLWLLRYPEGVSVEEGNEWYLGTHAQEVKQSGAFCRYLTWKPLEIPPGYDALGPDGRPQSFVDGQRPIWHRVTEMGFRDFDAWKARYDNRPVGPPGYSRPPGDVTPGGTPWGTDRYERVVIADKPDWDLLAEEPQRG